MQDRLLTKGNINENYNKDIIIKKHPDSRTKVFIDCIKDIIGESSKDNFLEVSHKYTGAYNVMLSHFNKGAFLSDDPFESMLTYHISKINNKDLDVLNYNFNYDSLSKLNLNEKFDFVFSLFGLTFEDLYTLLPLIIGFIKIAGILAINIPAYWFIKDNLTEIEKTIIDYSKQNDKKWIFVEPLEPLIEKNGAELLEIRESSLKYNIDRLELSFRSSLKKLYDSVIQNNKAHLDILKIPEKYIELRSAVMIIKKKKKTLTKENLFNL